MALGNFSKQPRCRYRDACDLRQKCGRFFHLTIPSGEEGEQHGDGVTLGAVAPSKAKL